MSITTRRPKYLFEQASLPIKSRMVEFDIAIQPQVILPYSKVRYYTILVGFEELVQNWSMYFPLYYMDTPEVLVSDVNI